MKRDSPEYARIQSWRADLKRRFPDWGSDQAMRRWPVDEKKLAVGKKVTGEVVANMGNLIWLDIGVSIPAHLYYFNRKDTCTGPPRISDYPDIGTKIECRITHFADGRISVTQRNLVDL